jgi:thiamine biosynthesis lipoprotein
VTELPEGTTPEDLQRDVDACLLDVNRKMSTYDPESELSRFNRHPHDDWFDVSAETATVVRRAQEIGEKTGGAFDVTVGPLVNLWSFGPDSTPGDVPSELELAAVRENVGWHLLEVRDSPPGLRKRSAGVYVDLSAIAKGFGVDRVAALLDRRGVKAYMIEIGGEVRTRGAKRGGSPWRIGIERPVSFARSLHKVVRLTDRALATSGDYRNFFEVDGVRYSHTIDPLTGRPVEHNLASVSVITTSCMEADAWATALGVLGPDAAYRYAEQNGLDVLLIVRQNGGFQEQVSPGFKAYVDD